MRIDIAALFFIIIFIFAASLSALLSSWKIFVVGFVAVLLVYLLGRRHGMRPLFAVCLFLVFIFGSFYFHLRDRESLFPPGSKIEGVALVSSFPERNVSSQKFEIKFNKPLTGSATVTSRLYPSFNYGDVIRISGEASYGRNDNLSIFFPSIEVLSSDRGNPIMKRLFRMRSILVSGIQKSLPPSSAALAAGILFGDQSGFSPEMWEMFRKTGTTHIVALSGSNIAIVAYSAAVVACLVSRRFGFMASAFAIILFVMMAGGGASAVRAAIMGMVMLLGRGLGRPASMRNVIALAALLMVIWDPGVAVFDIGFELSFAAVLGIIYIAPFVRRLFKWNNNVIRDLVLDTVSAEAAVMPIVMMRFGSVSWCSLMVNVLIIPTIPLAMGFGFISALSGVIGGAFARFSAIPADIIIQYELKTITFFADIF